MKKPRHKIVPLGQSKKKPSALLVYLALESAGRLKPMNREDIVKYINDNYGVHIEPKTVTEASSVLKSLSSGPKPIIDFHSHGKNGYQLGNAKSPLSQGQILQILASLSEVAPNSVQPTLASLAPLMNEEDLTMIKGVIAMMPERKEVTSGFDQTVFDTMEYIIEAYNGKKSIIFNHRFPDAEGQDIKTIKNVIMVPYYIFAKNGHYYVLGGTLQKFKREDKVKPRLYLADLAHMDQVGANDNQASELTIEDCIGYYGFNLRRFLEYQQTVREGPFQYNLLRAHTAEVYSEWTLLLTEMTYPGCVKVIDKKVGFPGKTYQKVTYTIELTLDMHSLVTWAIRFAPSGKLFLKDSSFLDRLILYSINERSSKAIQKYGPKPKLPAETKKND